MSVDASAPSFNNKNHSKWESRRIWVELQQQRIHIKYVIWFNLLDLQQEKNFLNVNNDGSWVDLIFAMIEEVGRSFMYINGYTSWLKTLTVIVIFHIITRRNKIFIFLIKRCLNPRNKDELYAIFFNLL